MPTQEENNKALLKAVRKGDEAEVTELLEPRDSVNAADKRGRTPLHWAAAKGDVNAAIQNGVTPLFMAAQEGYEAVARLLLENGADVNAVRSGSATPLFMAERYGHEEIADYLRHFAKLAKTEFLTALNEAAQKRINEIEAAADASPEPEPADPQLEILKRIFLDKIEGSSGKCGVIKHKSNFITLAMAVARLDLYAKDAKKENRKAAAKEIQNNIVKLTESGRIFTPENTLVGIDKIIVALSDKSYAEVFETTTFWGLTNLQKVLSKISKSFDETDYSPPPNLLQT